MAADSSATLRSAGVSDAGRRRQNNEDRIYHDADRGLFIVIDGVGGQAAGEKAAEIAMAAVRSGVDGDGSLDERIHTAIVNANNDIFREAHTSAELAGMSCVLTVAVVEDGSATVGHVGDTRLYKCRRGELVKVTHDHSPVGEQEESGALSEAEAMRHPMRNQVYRALGSAEHSVAEADFVDIQRVPFESDAALLLCSDGLTDLVPLGDISSIVKLHAGDPRAIVERLIDAANRAGGKDNVSVIFVEGPGFADSVPSDPDTTVTKRIGPVGQTTADARHDAQPAAPSAQRRPGAAFAALFVAGLVVGAAAASMLLRRDVPKVPVSLPREPRTIAVGTGSGTGSATIAGAIALADNGDTIAVEPGTYREQIVLTKNVTLTATRPREVVIQPAGVGDGAIVIDAPQAARVVGFKIQGSAEAPLPIGVLIRRGMAEIADLEISNTQQAAIAIDGGAPTVRGTTIRVGSGAGIRMRTGVSPRITHNVIARDNASTSPGWGIEMPADATPILEANVFTGFGADVLHGASASNRDQLLVGNIQLEDPAASAARPGAKRKPKGGS
jgi:PPM family protein phosphatase